MIILANLKESKKGMAATNLKQFEKQIERNALQMETSLLVL